MEIGLQLASLALAAAAIVPAVRFPFWWVRIFDFPRAQALALSLVVLALDLWLLDLSDGFSQLAILAVAAGVILELVRIVPYTRVNAVELREASSNDPGNRLSILTCNVLQDNRDAERLLALVKRRKPDILFLLEVDDWWEKALRELDRSYPHNLKRPQHDTYGMILYSRLELIDPEIREMRKEHVPSVKTLVKLPSGRTFRLYGLHPDPPAPQYAETTAQRDAELVLIGREAKAFDGPVVVIGDLNDVAWSHTTRLFRRLSGLLDPRIGRRTMATFPVAAPLLRFPLDHVFVSNHFKLHVFERLEDVGSDHFPVWAELQLETGAEVEQDEPEPEGDDQEEAEEIVAEANEELHEEDASDGTIPSPALGPVRVPQGS